MGANIFLGDGGFPTGAMIPLAGAGILAGGFAMSQ